ncbi:hypothetical protein JYK21_07580 [Ralstonia pickettii]|nr:hypothetical protein [Ralstonia pickettii]
MKVTITGINFIFDNGYQDDHTGVELQFITNGFKFTNNNPVSITRNQYEGNKSDPNGLRALVVDKILADVQGYVEDLNEYRESLMEQSN